MSELITLSFSARELEKICNVLQHSISQELEILQDNAYAPDSEKFIVFLESVQEQTEIYMKLSETLNSTEETEE